MSSQSNDIPEGFKITDLGPLPKEWEEVSLDNAADIIIGQSPPSSTYNTESVGLPFFQGKADFGDVYPTTRKWCSAPARIAEKYDVLLSVRAPIGDVNIATERCCIGRGLASIRANQKAEGKYLFYRLVFSKELLESKGTGTTFKEINKAAVTSLILPLPPLPEQKAIARVLSSIQKVIEAQDKIIATARELKKSLMRHLFKYGPVPVAEAEKVPLKETEIGPVPEHWDVVRLGEVTLKTKQVDPRRELAWIFKYVDVSGISREQLKIIDFTEYHGEEAPHRARKLVRTGDIIFATVRPYLKRMAIVPDEFDGQIVSTAFCVIRCRHDSAEPDYVFQVVTKDDFVQRVSEHQRGSSYPAVTGKDILSQMIPLPSIQEQQEVARMLSGVDSKIEVEENRKAALQALFKTMLHQLMTGKVRVKDLEATVA